MTEPVLIRIEDGVALITLNRPERLNAFNSEMGELFERTMVRVGLDPAVRVIVLTGAGAGFCAGADVERLTNLVNTRGAARSSVRPGEPQPILDALTEAPREFRGRYLAPMAVPQPVIAAINGACAGVGLSLAAACDIRFASRGAVFTAAFPRRGLTAEYGIAWTLPRLVGHGAAADILLSGRKFKAEEAQTMGLVNAALDPAEMLAHVMAYARDMADNASPRSTRVIKGQLLATRDQTAFEAVDLAWQEVVSSLACDDFQEGVAAFKEKRAPRFTGK